MNLTCEIRNARNWDVLFYSPIDHVDIDVPFPTPNFLQNLSIGPILQKTISANIILPITKNLTNPAELFNLEPFCLICRNSDPPLDSFKTILFHECRLRSYDFQSPNNFRFEMTASELEYFV